MRGLLCALRTAPPTLAGSVPTKVVARQSVTLRLDERHGLSIVVMVFSAPGIGCIGEGKGGML